ncbi:response regulator [Pontibacter diazotrophicus]|uniref:Response regulator n=1 Tax=Pontibacter diazotrophicus TaxID=1400979 RepID=A0A3D8L9Z6_9BACT|nr:response regulator [Pontibacter diazotrophicus]RDV14235.1 response regulator [Pontibacter diazotrophicus]
MSPGTWKSGGDVEVAENGAEAIEKVKQQEYELVLMDLHMPDMDGYEATSRIRNLGEEKYRLLPVIALSASAGHDYEKRMEDAGIDDFVSKPFNPTKLQGKIAYYTLSTSQKPKQDAESKNEAATVWQPKLHTADEPTFTLENFEELLADDEEDLEELARMTIHNFENYKREFQTALVSNDLKEYKASSHKIKTTVELLRAAKLQLAITKGIHFMEGDAEDQRLMKRISQEINHELNAVIHGLKEIQKSRWHRTGSRNTP